MINLIKIKNQELYLNDCFDIFPIISDKSVDAIMADLPFGTTNCPWDSVLPLNKHIKITKRNKIIYVNENDFLISQYKLGISYNEAKEYFDNNCSLGLWDHYKRIIKDNGVILLFGQTPFVEVLGNSNLEMLKYEWVWEKTQATGYFNAKKCPMKAHENILVFYNNLPTYNYQKTEGHNPINTYTKKVEVCNKTHVYGKVKKDVSGGGETDRYPRSVQLFSSDKQKNKLNGTIHSTQKPLELMKYFIKTYTNEGDLILDNTMGSGTTNLGSLILNRKSIGIDNDKVSFDKAVKRITDYK